MGLYERLLDLATILGEYYGHWNLGRGLMYNQEVMADIKANYTDTEIEQAILIMLREVAWSKGA